MKLPLPDSLKRDTSASRSPGLEVDCDLARRIREGDRAALARLLDRHTGRMQSYLHRRLGPGPDRDALVENVLKATFTEALRKMAPYARGSASVPMEMWLLRLAERNLARVHKKPKGKTHRPSESATDLERLRAVMEVLPGKHNSVLALALFEQMPAQEMAQALGTSPTGAMSRLRSALKRTARELTAQEEEYD
jgi:DNA-directed RNA polymerase specialized sigma24 family protein